MLTWENIDLRRGEIRLVSRKTSRILILPIAGPLRRHIEALPSTDNPAAPLHPRAHAIVEQTGEIRASLKSIRRFVCGGRLKTQKTTPQEQPWCRGASR